MKESLNELYTTKEVDNYYSTARVEIEDVFPKGAKRVLEIGCGTGATLSWLKKSGLANWVAGVDINQEELQAARKNNVDFVKNGNVEDGIEALLADAGGPFDVILYLDVLEHLYNPWSVVADTKNCIVQGGCVISSIPNTQNIRVILPLLFGKWEYKDCGLLDKTHIRFFTKKTAQEMFFLNGYSVTDVRPIYDKNKIMRFLNYSSLGLFRRFFVMQFLIVAKPLD